jgi:Protein of unknown function (DUF4238)
MAEHKDRSKAHHYLPQFYLRSFDSRHKGKNHYIFSFDKSTGIVTEPNIANVAHEQLFHEIINIEGEVVNYEDTMTSIEEPLRISWEAICREFTLATLARERLKLCVFFSFLLLRSAKVRNDIRRVMDEIVYKQAPAIAPGLVLPYSENTVRGNHYTLLREEREKVGLQFEKLKWVMCRNITAIPFVTADYPFAFSWQESSYVWPVEELPHAIPTDALFLDTEGVFVSIPVTPRTLLIICDPVKYADWPSFMLPRPEMVRSLNDGLVLRCIRNVFSSKNEFDFARRIIDKLPSLRNLDAPRWNLQVKWEPVEPEK